MRKVLEIAVGSRPPTPRWGVRGDGSITSLDALMILLQAAADAIDLYPNLQGLRDYPALFFG